LSESYDFLLISKQFLAHYSLAFACVLLSLSFVVELTSLFVFSYSVFNVQRFLVLALKFVLSRTPSRTLCYLFRFQFWFCLRPQSRDYSALLFLAQVANRFCFMLLTSANLCTRRFPHRHLLSYRFNFFCQQLIFYHFTNRYIKAIVIDSRYSQVVNTE
jgi:hypothetical protein